MNMHIESHISLRGSGVVPCLTYNSERCRFVLVCERPEVEGLLHNTAVFNQRKSHTGVTASRYRRTPLQSVVHSNSNNNNSNIVSEITLSRVIGVWDAGDCWVNHTYIFLPTSNAVIHLCFCFSMCAWA